MTLRALLVDDEAPARSELRYLLQSHPGVEIVGEAASAVEALELSRKLPHDVVFLDVEMPGLTGVEAAPLVRERARSARDRLRDRARALRRRRVRGRGVRLPAEAGRPRPARARRRAAAGALGRERRACGEDPGRRRSRDRAARLRPGALRAGGRRLQPRAHLRPLVPLHGVARRARGAAPVDRASRASIAPTSSTSARSRASGARRPTASACSSRTRSTPSSTWRVASRASCASGSATAKAARAARGSSPSSRR